MRTRMPLWTSLSAIAEAAAVLWKSLPQSLGMMATGDKADASPSEEPDASRDEERDASPAEEDPLADRCYGGTLEPDVDYDGLSLTGPGVVDGRLEPGTYIISTTFLRLKPGTEIQSKFLQLSTPVLADVRERDGLIGMAVAISTECRTARTLTVWRDEAAMYQFACGEAHGKAMVAIDELSRGESIAMHWMSTEAEASWQPATEQHDAFRGTTR